MMKFLISTLLISITLSGCSWNSKIPPEHIDNMPKLENALQQKGDVSNLTNIETQFKKNDSTQIDKGGASLNDPIQ